MAITGNPNHSLDHTKFGLPSRLSTWSTAFDLITQEKPDETPPTIFESMNSKKFKHSKAIHRGQIVTQKNRKIFYCLQELQNRNALCPEHESIVISSLSTSQPHRNHLSQITHASPRLIDHLEERFLGNLVQLKQIYGCLRCRNLLKKNVECSNLNEDFVHHKRFFHRLLRRCLNSTDNDFKNYLENSYDNLRSPETCEMCSDEEPLTEKGHTKSLDKSQYCWEWLLCSGNDQEEGVPNWTNFPRNCDSECNTPVYVKRSNTCPSNEFCPQWSRCPLTTKQGDSSLDSGSSSSADELCGLESKYHTADQSNCRIRGYLPHHVTRRSDGPVQPRLGQHNCEHHATEQCSSTLPYSTCQRRTVQHEARPTPWFATSTESKFNSDLWSAFSSMNLRSSREDLRSRQNTQTIDFLSSISPTISIVPPPNHNPFAKNESV